MKGAFTYVNHSIKSSYQSHIKIDKTYFLFLNRAQTFSPQFLNLLPHTACLLKIVDP